MRLVKTPLFGAGKTHFCLGPDMTLLLLEHPGPSSFGRSRPSFSWVLPQPSSFEGWSGPSFSWVLPQPSYFWSRLRLLFFGGGRTHFCLVQTRPSCFRAGQDPFSLGLAGPIFAWSRLGPATFRASQDLDSSRSKLGSAAFVVGQDPFL